MVRSDSEQRMTGKVNDARLSDYRMLFRGAFDAEGTDDRAMALAPLSYWLCDRLDPERILTLGAGCELLHITMCEKAQKHVMQASCLHVAERFSAPFLTARKAYGSAQSQVLVPDPGAVRMGIEGQFDLIFIFSSGPFSKENVATWVSALTADGLLVVCSEAEGDMPVGDRIMHWQFGTQKLLIASPPVPDGRLTQVEQLSGALKAGHSSLANALAACAVDLALRAKNALGDKYEEQLEAQNRRHAADLISVTKKLAKVEQENINLRQELRLLTTQLQAYRSHSLNDVEA